MMDLKMVKKEHKVLVPWADVALSWTYKYYKQMDDNDIYVVTMCEYLLLLSICYILPDLVFNPTICQTWTKYCWEDEYPRMARKMVLDAVSVILFHHTFPFIIYPDDSLPLYFVTTCICTHMFDFSSQAVHMNVVPN